MYDFNDITNKEYKAQLVEAFKDNPKTMKQAISLAHTRAWWYVMKNSLVDTPAEKAYTDKCIANAEEKHKHLPKE